MNKQRTDVGEHTDNGSFPDSNGFHIMRQNLGRGVQEAFSVVGGSGGGQKSTELVQERNTLAIGGVGVV